MRVNIKMETMRIACNGFPRYMRAGLLIAWPAARQLGASAALILILTVSGLAGAESSPGTLRWSAFPLASPEQAAKIGFPSHASSAVRARARRVSKRSKRHDTTELYPQQLSLRLGGGSVCLVILSEPLLRSEGPERSARSVLSLP